MNRRALINFSIVLILTLVVVGVYVAWYITLQKQGREVATLLSDIARIEQENVSFEETKGLAEALAEDETALAEYFVAPDDIVQFLETLEGTGDTLGSSVEVVSVTGSAGGDATRATLSLSITGSFSAVMRTLGAFEYGPTDMRLVALTLDGTTREGVSLWRAASTFSVALMPQTP